MSLLKQMFWDEVLLQYFIYYASARSLASCIMRHCPCMAVMNTDCTPIPLHQNTNGHISSPFGRSRGLPCYNATDMLQPPTTASSTGGPAEFGSESYMAVVWAKVRVMQQVLKLGYNLFFSDVDVVYLRPVHASYKRIFDVVNPDAIFMHEEIRPPAAGVLGPQHQHINVMNSGVYAMRSNNASLQLVDMWLDPANRCGHGNQCALNSLAYRGFMLCTSSSSCSAARAHTGMAAVYRHPQQFADVAQLPDKQCPSPAMPPGINMCHDVRLYVHGICTKGWSGAQVDPLAPPTKTDLYTAYSLWLVDEKGQPLYMDQYLRRHRKVLLLKSRRTKRLRAESHPYLPCTGPAWQQQLLE